MLTGLSVYLPESLLTVFDNLEFLIRIVLAAILGAMVGLERTGARAPIPRVSPHRSSRASRFSAQA